MSLKLPMTSSRDHARQTLRLGIVRFHTLLDNARRLLDLVQDGNEKLAGEYIFDRQYVVSLVDGAVVQLGRLVFDAQVLRPEEAEALYEAYDAQREAAVRLLSAALRGEEEARHADPSTGPEFRLLRDAVRWMEGSTGARDASPSALLDAILDQAVLALAPPVRRAAPDRSLEIATQRGSIPLDLIDLEGLEDWPPDPDRRPLTLRNRPLDLMLGGAGSESTGAGGHEGARRGRWLVVLNDQQLSLFGSRDEFRVVAEAALCGDPSRDFVFLWSRSVDDLPGLGSVGLSPRRTGRGLAAWRYDRPTRDLEETLTRLGGALWGGT